MTNDNRPVQRPASNSTARKRDEEARAVSYSWPLSEAQVAALVERLEAQAREAAEGAEGAERALEALGRERNTWARQLADMRGERDDQRTRAEAEESERRRIDNERTSESLRADDAEAEVARLREMEERVKALVDDEGRADVAFGARPFKPRGMDSRVLHLNDVRAALRGDS